MNETQSKPLPQPEKALIRRYYLSMLSLAGVVVVLAGVSVSITGHLYHLSDLVLSAVMVLVLLNLLGARIIFSPIARYLNGDVDLEIARRRIRKLPAISAGWAFLVVLVHMYGQFFFHHIWYVRHAPNLIELVAFPIVLITIFGAFMGLYAGMEAMLWTFVLGGCVCLIALVWKHVHDAAYSLSQDGFAQLSSHLQHYTLSHELVCTLFCLLFGRPGASIHAVPSSGRSS